MPFKPMLLRGTKVLARCLDDGSLVAPGGRVEIRYKPTDTKSYAAALANLVPIAGAPLLPDAGFASATPAPPKTKAGAASIAPTDPSITPGSASRTPTDPPIGPRDPSIGPRSASIGPRSSSRTTKATAGKPPTRPVPGGVLAYADGACSGNPGPAGLGVVLITETSRHELSEFLGHGTNNIAELTAIQRAAEAVVDPSVPVQIMTDSSYAIGVLSKGWKAKANQALIVDVKKALARLSRWELGYVPGHSGVPLNERADELAVAAVRDRHNAGWRKVTP